ncbi:hypothetical protein [Polaromonas naphthalenivorans]|uniref:Uncharacterized protein n=1 Tax=Polaromonas naphthalenivorans (strain CJ2) TaxID=365044 RepID=A1VPK6_POLNA|nr:hypothetical protein [Polaromonas naphthalenivorans]ABM37584.1 hypothetical protein Pnap_2276 [Polaromonas naphthalenivorans CJ2]
MKRPSPDGVLLRQRIAEDSATPSGFVIERGDAEHQKNAYKICSAWVKQGKLFKVKAPCKMLRFFDSQAASDAWLARQQAAMPAPAPEPAKAPRRAKQPKAAQTYRAADLPFAFVGQRGRVSA